MFRAFHRILPDVRCPRAASAGHVAEQFVVADDKQLLDRPTVLRLAMRETLLEYVAVVLRLDVLAAMRSISEMHERVDVALAEKLHRIRDVGERKAAVRRHAVPAGLQMSVGEYAEDEVRLLLRLLI